MKWLTLISLLTISSISLAANNSLRQDLNTQEKVSKKITTVTFICPQKGCLTVFGQDIAPKPCNEKYARVSWDLEGEGNIYPAYVALTDDNNRCGCFKPNKHYEYGMDKDTNDKQEKKKRTLEIDLNDFEWTMNCEGAAVCSTGYSCKAAASE